MRIQRSRAVIYFVTFIFIVAFSFLRESLILLYPFMALILGWVFRLRIKRRYLLVTLLFIGLGLMSSVLSGGYYGNLLISLYLIVPVFILLQTEVAPSPDPPAFSLYDKALTNLAIILAIVDLSAIIYSQFLINPAIANYDDAFTGLYGMGGLGSHMLSVMNLGFSVYFLSRRKFVGAVFFLLCGVFGFYGLGLLIFLAALLILYALRFLRYWKIMLSLGITAILAIVLIRAFNARNLEYIETNIERSLMAFEGYDYTEELARAENMQITTIPRFITFVVGAKYRLFSEPKVMLLGTTPGGYNSRTAFYLNGDFVQNPFIRDNIQIRTPYHADDVYPLLNRELLAKPYNDGTRNQTFSSIISLFLEYGLLGGGLFILTFFGKMRQIILEEGRPDRKEYLRFLTIYTFILFSLQNYLEYPEVILPIVLIFKLAESDQVYGQERLSSEKETTDI